MWPFKAKPQEYPKPIDRWVLSAMDTAMAETLDLQVKESQVEPNPKLDVVEEPATPEAPDMIGFKDRVIAANKEALTECEDYIKGLDSEMARDKESYESHLADQKLKLQDARDVRQSLIAATEILAPSADLKARRTKKDLIDVSSTS